MITLKAPVIHPQTGKILLVGSTVSLPDDFEAKIIAAGNAIRCAAGAGDVIAATAVLLANAGTLNPEDPADLGAADPGTADPGTADPGTADPVGDQPKPASVFLGRMGLSNK